MKPEFKLARYANWGYPNPDCGPEYGQVLYAIFGRKCIFTGVTNNVTSTINACEAIVEEIARLEGCAIDNLEFYDLQTHVSYSKEPGIFEIDRVVIHRSEDVEETPDDNRVVIGSPHPWKPGWDTAKLPQRLIERFRPCIGKLGQPRTYEKAQEEIAKAYGLVLTAPELN
jgi:hypothetical protein